MCGIVGYIGNKEAISILLEGLRELEYRGYDSAGIALLEDGRITRFRAVGKLDNLVDRAADYRSTGPVAGIGLAEEPYLIKAFTELCTLEVDDGIRFDAQSIRTEEIPKEVSCSIPAPTHGLAAAKY